jgi:hypothetical protein
MKLKDIKVGEEYAIGAPNATYDRWSRIRGKVVRIRVYGSVRGTWRRSQSSKPNYVEFEMEDCTRPGIPWMYQCHADPAPGSIRVFDDWYLKSEKKGTKVFRCPSTHVLLPWSEYEVMLAEHQTAQVEADARREQKEKDEAAIKKSFRSFGLNASTYGDFRFRQEDAEEILNRLERLRLFEERDIRATEAEMLGETDDA